MPTSSSCGPDPLLAAVAQEFLVGGVGQEFVQSELSRSDQGPPRALLEIRRRAGLRSERCMPLLQMLDQLGRPRLTPICLNAYTLMLKVQCSSVRHLP
jgi:hypothetical protein